MQDSNKSVFRQGFVFGFGLIIPLAFGFFGYTVIDHKISQVAHEEPSTYESYESYKSKEDDYTKKIEILNFKDTREGEFVYEKNEYISKNLEPNEIENFAITCGCANNKIPDYSKVTVRVVGANDY